MLNDWGLMQPNHNPDWIKLHPYRVMTSEAWKLPDYLIGQWFRLGVQSATSDRPGYLPNDLRLLWEKAGVKVTFNQWVRDSWPTLARLFRESEDQAWRYDAYWLASVTGSTSRMGLPPTPLLQEGFRPKGKEATGVPETPDGLHAMSYAHALLEALCVPIIRDLMQVAAATITAVAAERKIAEAQAHDWLLARAQEDKKAGIMVNRFWFTDPEKYNGLGKPDNRPRDVKPYVIQEQQCANRCGNMAPAGKRCCSEACEATFSLWVSGLREKEKRAEERFARESGRVRK